MKDPFAKDNVKILVIGGGTGSFTLLSGLKNHTSQIAALVNMVDDGGSTGVLRDELGVLPPGDVRQCLVALSDSPKLRDLFSYRFEEGTFAGHSFGNILLTALEKMTGNFADAVETAGEILRITGSVIPSTLDNVSLKMEWPSVSTILHGERTIADEYFKHDPKKAKLSLVPEAKTNPVALKAVEQADLIVIAPGDLYASLGPTLVMKDIGLALRKAKAVKVYVANLVTKKGQTEGFSVTDHADEIQRFAGGEFLDYVLYNEKMPAGAIMKRYEAEGAYPVKFDPVVKKMLNYQLVAGDFLGQMAKRSKSDALLPNRSLIRHEPKAVAQAIMDIYDRNQSRNITD